MLNDQLLLLLSRFSCVVGRESERKKESEVTQSCPTLCNPMDSSLHQAPPFMGFFRQEYWSGLPFPSPGNLAAKPLQSCPTLCDPIDDSPPGSTTPGIL